MLKRIFDLIVASGSLLFLSPFLIIVSCIIKLTDRGPVFYRGVRAGRYDHAFKIFKFRSMVVNADKIGGSSTADGDPRITAIGIFLRKYKLDELPQFINVLFGDMSIVGPRPEVQYYVDLYTEEEKVILGVRPGITDFASLWNADEGAILAGADDPDKVYMEEIRPEKLRLQMEYVHQRSLWIDIKIIVQTISTILGFPQQNTASNPKRT
jgi:lipopolysaccharide/colanic/teichoic acid biosynthesis glycosyltransferase